MSENKKRTSITLDNKPAIELAMKQEMLGKSYLSSYINRLLLDDLFGRNEILREPVVAFYENNGTGFEESLRSVIQYFIRFPNHRVKEVRLILNVINSMFAISKWQKKEAPDSAEDIVAERMEQTSCIFRIFKVISEKIKVFEKYAEENNIEHPWEMAPEPISTEKDWINRDYYGKQAELLREKIQDSRFLPLELIILISENWTILSPYREIYELLLWCLQATTNWTLNEGLYKQFRLSVSAISKATADIPQYSSNIRHSISWY